MPTRMVVIPARGTKTKPALRVPTMEPRAPRADTRPEACPTSAPPRATSLTAMGLTVPMSTPGTTKRIALITSGPIIPAKASATTSRRGALRSGMTPTARPAKTRDQASVDRCGRRSARTPPR
jgi:hypothetical protein